MSAARADAAARFALGTQLAQQGRLAEAETVLAELAAARPKIPEVQFNLALVRERSGRFAEAAEAYRAYVALRPRDPAGLVSLAAMLRHGAGELDEAERLLRRAVAAAPESAEAHAELGLTRFRRGRMAEAAEALRRAVALDPRHFDALNNLGLVLDALSRREEAEAMLRRAIAAAPARGAAVTNLAALLRVDKRPAAAEAVLRAALPRHEKYPGVLRELGIAVEQQQRPEEALALYERAASLDPADADSRECLGSVLLSLGRYAEAGAAYEAALTLHPDSADAHFSLGCIRLLQGDFARGWSEHEWRLKLPRHTAALEPIPGPRWTGAPLEGRRILLHREQGSGDTIQFARYVPLVAAAGGEVVLSVYPPLRRLLSRLPGVAETVTPACPPPRYDLQAMLGSLPLLLGVTAPAAAGYLTADSGLAEDWARRLGPRLRPRVGLVWAGSPTHDNDATRSIDLAELAPILAVEGVDFISLQVGERAADIAAAGLGGRIRDIARELGDYADTAAALTQIDLVVSVDTSVVHLAGALGRPCWVLLPFVPDWRWLLDRSDSPWYRSLRLFRQRRRGDWTSVVGEAAAALATEMPRATA